MSTKIERLERANADLQRELREKESELKRLSVRSSLDKDFKRVQQLEQRLREAHQHLEHQEAELIAVKDQHGKLLYEVDILRHVVQLKDHPELLRAADGEVRARKLEKEVRSLKEELIGATEKSRIYFDGCSKAAREADTLRHQCAQLQEELERRNRDLRGLLMEREGFVRESSDVSDALEALQLENRALKDQSKDLQSRLDERDLKIRAMEKDVSTSRHDEQNALRTWEEGHRFLEAARSKLKDLETEHGALLSKWKLLSDEDATNQRRYDSLMKTADSLRGENKHMRDQLAAWQSRADEMDAMRTRLSAADAAHDKTLEQISSLQETVASLREKLADRDKELTSVSRELQEAREEVGIQMEQMNVLSRNLMSRLESVEGERDRLQKERDQFQKDFMVAQEKASTLSILMTHHQSLSRSALQQQQQQHAQPNNPVMERGEVGASTSVPTRLDPTMVTARQTSSPVRLSHQRSTTADSSDIALSPPTPVQVVGGAPRHVTSSNTPSAGHQHAYLSSQELRTRLERLAGPLR